MSSFLDLLLAPLKLLVAPVQWLRNASLAARLAAIVSIFQIVIVLLATTTVLLVGEWAILQLWWSPGKIVVLCLLFVMVPVLVYRSTLLWCEQPMSRWPDITTAWRSVLVDLKRAGISLSESPLFFVFGSDGGEQEKAFLKSARFSLVVTGSPGGGPLRVYASEDAIFVCLNSIGLSCFAAQKCRADDNAVVDSMSRRDALSRLDTFCDLIRQQRSPLVPMNGLVVILPLELSHRVSRTVAELGRALADDIHRLTNRFGVRVPVTFFGHGLEQEAGLTDLLTLLAKKQTPIVNPDQTVSQPTGREDAKGSPFPVGGQPTEQTLFALAIHAVGPLADEIGEMLLDPSRLNEQGASRQLVALVCRLRLHGEAQLFSVLKQVFAREVDVENTPLLAGGFVGALHDDPTKQAFIRGVLDYVVDQQAELEWT